MKLKLDAILRFIQFVPVILVVNNFVSDLQSIFYLGIHAFQALCYSGLQTIEKLGLKKYQDFQKVSSDFIMKKEIHFY